MLDVVRWIMLFSVYCCLDFPHFPTAGLSIEVNINT